MQRRSLVRGVKLFSGVFGLALLYVLLDFMIDTRPASVHSSYRFKLSDLPIDVPLYLRQDNLSIVVIQRSDQLQRQLQQSDQALQDATSKDSRQPDYAQNGLRSRYPDYFVSYAIGTDLGCTLETITNQLHEICSKARYDFAGRALQGDNQFSNLTIPDYDFTNNFNTLTIKP